jgi:hypothetical protein
MQVKIQRGGSTIEVEGSFDEVEKILQQFWASRTQPEETDPLPPEEGGNPKKSARRKGNSSVRSASKVANDFDAQPIVNKIKADDRYATFEKKIIIPKLERKNKAMFVAWYTDAALTSGNIHQVLRGLGINIDPATVSRGLSDAKNEYLIENSGTRRATYKLTVRAHTSFAEWLLSDGGG